MLTSKNAALLPFGLFPTGDWSLWTIYTTKRHKVVSFLRSPPTEPPSPAQLRQRNRWTAIAHQWSSLGRQGQDPWKLAAARAHLRITAFNLYLYYHSTGDLPCLATIATQSHVPLASLL